MIYSAVYFAVLLAVFGFCNGLILQMSESPVLKVGIIGAGRIGRVHLDTLASIPNAKPVYLSDVVEPVLNEVAAKYGITKKSANPDDLIFDPEVDAVWICSPSFLHADQIRKCASAGKHIFCEKPIATSLAETISAVEYVKEKGVKFMTAFQRRYDPSFARLHKAVVDGEVGEPVQAVLQSRDPSPPPFTYVKGGGGLFKDMAIHDLDIASWLMNARGPNEPVKVFAVGNCFHDKQILELKESNPSEAIDAASIQIEFEKGTHAVIQVNRRATWGYDQRVEFIGTDGLLNFENFGPNTVNKWTSNYFGKVNPLHDFFMTRYKEAYIQETASFVDAIIKNEVISPSGEDGIRALKLAMACDKSLKEGRVVHLSEITP